MTCSLTPGEKPVLSASSLTKRECAYQVTRALLSNKNAELILLTGSVARGIETNDSDVDLALFTNETSESFIQTHQIHGTLVEVDVYAINRVAKGPSTPLLSLQDLREVGRFSTGEVLFSRWEHLAQARASWLRALLHPDEVIRLLALSSTYLDPIHLKSYNSFTARVWMLQGAAAALATLALCLFPFRFQKPKWVIHDLKEAKLSHLLENIRTLYFGRKLDAESTEELLGIIKKQLLAGLQLGGLPPLALSATRNDHYYYLYRTFCDAISLRNDGDFEGSVYTAMYAIRLLNATLQDSSNIQAPVRKEEIDRWRRVTIESLIAAEELDEGTFEEIRYKLSLYGKELEQEYKRRFIENQPFEVFSEGSWRNQQ